MPKPKPICPACGSRKSEQAKGGLIRCTSCGGLFDQNPHEGGTCFADPSKRMMLQEEEAERNRRTSRPAR